MSETVRVFIAVEIPTTPKLRNFERKLATMGRAVKPVAVGRLHATLQFLGDVDVDVIPLVTETLERTVKDYSAFTLRMVGLGAFPRIERPSVVWAGIEDAEPLIGISRNLATELESLGFAADPKPFHPHATLARVRSRPPQDLAALFAEHASTEFGTAVIEDVRLFESELHPDGPRYTVLHVAKLYDT